MGYFYIEARNKSKYWFAISRAGIPRAGIPVAVPILYCPDMVGTSRDDPYFSGCVFGVDNRSGTDQRRLLC